MSGLVAYLASLAKIGGPVIALVGIGAWYWDRREAEEHEAEQNRLDRLSERVQTLEEKLSEQHDKIVEQGRTISDLRSELAEADRVKAAKDGQIMRLEAQVDALQTRISRLEASDPAVSDVQPLPAARADTEVDESGEIE